VFLGHDFLSTAYFLPLGLISTMATPHAAPAAGHRRNKSSTSVLKSIVSRGHMRAPSDGAELKKDQLTSPPPYIPATNFKTPLLPPDHPHSQLRGATRTESIPTNPPASRRAPSQDAKQSRPKSLHKKTPSAVSLRTLAKKEENPRDKKPVDARRPQEEDRMAEKPKKIKSSANLAAMFGKGRSRDKSPVKPPVDKENTTPPTSADASGPPRAPIWAEFSSGQPLQEVTTTSRVPLNDHRRSVEEEIALYTPHDYLPSKQRNFFEYGQPALQKRPTKERPKSMVVPKSTSTTSLLETFSRKKSNERAPLADTKGNEPRIKDSASSKNMSTRPVLGRASTDTSRKDDGARPTPQPVAAVKKPNRVMAAVAAFNGKSKGAEASASSTKLDPKVVDEEFEVVLVSF
jgi:hypothetical protein